MKFTPLPLQGTYLIEPEPMADERGFFARTFCHEEFTAHDLNAGLLQCSLSFNTHKGTLRGMHYQKEPHSEAKLVRCTMGSVYDVIIDLRRDSATYMQWTGVELSAQNRQSIYIPEGIAHGFLTLVDNCVLFYQISEYYHPESSAGVRWNDPVFSIHWPTDVSIISGRDRDYPDFGA